MLWRVVVVVVDDETGAGAGTTVWSVVVVLVVCSSLPHPASATVLEISAAPIRKRMEDFAWVMTYSLTLVDGAND